LRRSIARIPVVATVRGTIGMRRAVMFNVPSVVDVRGEIGNVMLVPRASASSLRYTVEVDRIRIHCGVAR
jgi:hypothetical protein